MNNGHKTITAMLAVVAVLLLVNIVQGPRAASRPPLSVSDAVQESESFVHGLRAAAPE